MTRLVTIAALAASLLLWSVPAYSVSPQEFSDEMSMMADASYQNLSCRSTTCSNPHCRACLASGHRRAIGLPLPSIILPYIGCPMLHSGHGLPPGHSFAQRLSGTAPVAPQQPMPMTIPVPVGPPPSSFAGGVFMPQQYRQMQPAIAGHAHLHGQGYAQAHVYIQGQGYAQGQGHAQGQGYAQGQDYTQGQGYAQRSHSVPEQRIVYVPYMAPPQIHVHRPGRPQPQPRPPLLRRMLGDANMYEYPEMPQRLYTTRGPRDFLAPNPPGIGE